MENGKITYISPVLDGIFDGKVGESLTKERAWMLAERLASALEMAAGLRPSDGLLEKLTTREAERSLPLHDPGETVVVSFSGGVADCIAKDIPWQEFGDLGPLLGQAIRRSSLCRGEYLLGEQTIRATVIGAGCHSAQLSGSTVFCQNAPLPLKNIPVVTGGSAGEGAVFWALPGIASPSYRQVQEMAEKIAEQSAGPVYLCLEADMAKALGQALALRLGREAQILCIDRIRLTEGSFLDVGLPVGPAFPVVVKTLILQRQ